MSKKQSFIRFMAILLVVCMMIGVIPAGAYNLEDAPPFPDEAVQTQGYLQDENMHKVEDLKYLKIYLEGSLEPFSEGFFGVEPTKSKAIVPGCGGLIIEFNQEQTQEIRMELWSEDGETYLGLINSGQAIGQWGTYNGEQYPFDPENGIDERYRAANYFVWDGLYFDTLRQAWVFPAEDESGNVAADIYNYRIVFQPTDPETKEYRTEMLISIDYTDGGMIETGQLVSRDELPWVLDPVFVVNGNFTWSYSDIALHGAKPLEFARHYNAQDKTAGELGYGWRHTYSVSLEKTSFFATVTFADGYKYTYNVYGDGSFIPPEGVTATLEASGGGYVLTEQDKTQYLFDSNGRLTAIVDVGGDRTEIARNGAEIASISNDSGTLTFTYSGGKISRITDQAGRYVEYTYDGSGDLVSFKNADGDSIGYTYAAHLMTEISDFEGNTYLKNTYDDIGRIVEQFMAGQGTSTISYDFPNRVSTVTDPKGAVTKYHYDVDQKITAIEDVSGQRYFEYSDGRLVKETDRLGNSTAYTYDSNGNMTSTTYPDGTSVLYEYNSLNLVTKKTAQDGGTTLFSYDGKGNLISLTDSRGNSVSYVYDENNNLIEQTDALGGKTAFTYDTMGNCLTQTDPLGNVTSFEYDGQGRLLKRTNADTSTVEYEYSNAGKLVKTTDAEGNVYETFVNGNGFETGTKDAMGYERTTVLNDQNQPVSVTDAMGGTTAYEYDSTGRMIKTTDALGNSVQYEYDLAGRLTSMTDAMGNTWSYVYDSEGRVTSITDALGNTSTTAYDNMGRVTTSKNALGAETSYSYDAMGRTNNLTDALGNSERYVFDQNGNLIEEYDKKNNKWSYEYDADNRMVKAIDPLGFITSYEYDANGQAVKTVSSLGAQVGSEYDSMGRLVKTVDAEGNETAYTYDLLGRLTKTTFADGTSATNEYNANGWLVKATAGDGGVTSYTYDKNGRVLSITDALGGKTEYTYDALGRVTSVTDALDGSIAYTYDANGNILTVTDAMGGVTEYSYDKLNRVIGVTDPLGGRMTAEYDANGNITKITNPDGGATTYTYDLLDRLTGYTDAEGYTFSFGYDANGNGITSTDGRGNVSSIEYDALDRAIKNIDEAGGISTVEYDADGRVVKTTDSEGAVTNYEYDLNGNIVKVTNALGNATTFTYDSMNRLSAMTDARGAVSSYTYTATGLVETVTDALEGVKSYEYDLLGRLVKETNELGESTEYTYDALGRVLSVKNPLGSSDSFTYDALGRIVTVTDKNGNVTEYKYDANGNIIETIDALGASSFYEYDAMDRLVKVTLNRTDTLHGVDEDQITLYQYDKRGLVTKEINAAGDETLYIYDGNGNLIQTTDADGYVTEYSYDPRDLVDAINYSDGKQVQFAYNANGELVAMMDWNGTVNFELDLLGQITSVNDQNEKITSYAYDAVGNKTSMTYPDGTTASYEYDLLGRLTSLTDAEEQDTIYEYDAASRLIATAYPNGWLESYTYDATGQLVRQYSEDPTKDTDKSIEYTYTYDGEGNVLREYSSGGGGQEKYDLTHQYDALDRLTKTEGKWGYATHTYQYDSLGNLIYEKTGSGNKKGNEYWYNELNQQVKKQVDGKDSYTYSYDGRGNLVKGVYGKKSAVVEEYTYDATNRMVKGVNEAGEESHYIYNGFGYLVSNEWIIEKNGYGYTGVETEPSVQVDGVVVCDRHKHTTGQGHINPTGKGHTTGGTEGGTAPSIGKKQAVIHKDYTIDYTSPLKNVIIEEESGAGGLSYRYVYGLDKVSVGITGELNGAGGLIQDGQVKLYYHHDRLGTTRYLTDNVDGQVASYVSYDDWGQPTMKPILKMGLRELDLVTEYTGHPYDQVLGLYFAEARMYDAADRRFTAMDPVKGTVTQPATLTRYTYCINNPLKYVDPWGLNPVADVMRPEYLPAVVAAAGAAGTAGLIIIGGALLIWGASELYYMTEEANAQRRAEEAKYWAPYHEAAAIVRPIIGTSFNFNFDFNFDFDFDFNFDFDFGIDMSALSGLAALSTLTFDFAFPEISIPSFDFPDITFPDNYFPDFSCGAEIAEKIPGIAGKYGNYECVKAAKDIQKYLKRNKKNGEIIIIRFSGSPQLRNNFVISKTYPNVAISMSGMHQGVKYLTNVYCNVHPYGLPEPVWIEDFQGLGIRTIERIPF